MSPGIIQRNPFFVSAIFFLVLGMGNVGVGMYRTSQYAGVFDQLTETSLPRLAPQSAITRLQAAQLTHDRDAIRREHSRVKRDFYEFVIFGGKIFLLISALLFGIAIFRHQKTAAEQLST